MSDYTELKRLAEAFPADLDWDSNTEPFFNGPSGESLGGGSTGFYCVYGAPFEIDDEQYDGPTYVETCNADFAKFMVAAREGVLTLIAERDQLFGETEQLKAENEALRKDRDMVIKVLGLSLDEFTKMAGTISSPRPNKGHGHVFPRADGVLARCGGPGLCKECRADKLKKENGQCS